MDGILNIFQILSEVDAVQLPKYLNALVEHQSFRQKVSVYRVYNTFPINIMMERRTTIFTDFERTGIGYITSDKFDEQFRNETSRIDAFECFSAAMFVGRVRAEGCPLDNIVHQNLCTKETSRKCCIGVRSVG